MAQSQRKNLLFSNIFDCFPVNVRNAVYAKAEYRDYAKGEWVFRTGEQGTFIAGVVSGRLRMGIKSLEGKEMLITMVNRGEIFGEMSILDDMPRAVDVFAETECRLMIIKRDDFIPLLKTYPEAILSLIRVTCHRMRRYLYIMELIALQSVPVRLAEYLLRLAEDYGIEHNGNVVIRSGMNQAAIGQHIAVSREGVNKQLHIFADKGLLSLKGNEITLHDIDGLKKFISYFGSGATDAGTDNVTPNRRPRRTKAK